MPPTDPSDPSVPPPRPDPSPKPNRADRRRAAKPKAKRKGERLDALPKAKLQAMRDAIPAAPAWEGSDPDPIVIRDAEVTAAQMAEFEHLYGQPYFSVRWAEAPIDAYVQLAHVWLKGSDRPLTVDEIRALPGRAITMDLAHSPLVRSALAANSDRTQALTTGLIATLIDGALERLEQTASS